MEHDFSLIGALASHAGQRVRLVELGDEVLTVRSERGVVERLDREGLVLQVLTSFGEMSLDFTPGEHLDDATDALLEELAQEPLSEGELEHVEAVASLDCDAMDHGLLTIKEASEMDPFRRKSSLGPGPKGQTHKKRSSDRYKCKCAGAGSKVVCKCTNKEHGTRTIEIPYSYKRAYNAGWRKWAASKNKGSDKSAK